MADRICSCGKPIELGIGRPRKSCRECRPPQDRTPNIACAIPCQGCGKDFVTTTKVQKFCSDRCRQDYWWTRADRVACSVCGQATGYRSNRKNSPTSPKCADCTKRTKPVRRVGDCSEQGCSKPARSGNSGLCKTHYSRRRYSGTTKNVEEQCSVKGCERKCISRQMCPTHYSTWHRSQLKYQVVCPVCGKHTQVARRRNKHCSYDCAMKAVAAERVGIAIADWLEQGPRPKRLTKIQRAQRKLDKAALGTSGRTIWVGRTCKICAEEFITQSSSTGTCCSYDCTKANRRNKAVDAGARRRARKRNAYVAPVKRLEIFKRDKYRCYICKRMTNPKVCVPHPRAPTIDHIIPLAKGGTHEPANAATACFECNCYKRDLGGYEQLALIG